jgi:hypothetical protein
MGKLREDGLLLNPRWHNGPFAGIHLGGAMQYNGIKVENPIMTINVATNPAADETFGIGTKTYTFKNSGATGDQINLGATAALTAVNIITKINADNASGTQCSAYPLGSSTMILLVDNYSRKNTASPGWTNDGAKVVEVDVWMNEIPQHMLILTDYFAVDPVTDTDTKPIKLTERNAGTYQNFLY